MLMLGLGGRSRKVGMQSRFASAAIETEELNCKATTSKYNTIREQRCNGFKLSCRSASVVSKYLVYHSIYWAC